MNDALLSALTDTETHGCYLMTTVTNNCIIVKNPNKPVHTIISLTSLSGIRVNQATFPGLLVISAGLLILAAAAFSSKQGDGAGLPISILGLIVAVGYLVSRRASLIFTVDSETTQTVQGSLSDAARLRKAVREARARADGVTGVLPADEVVRIKRSLMERFGRKVTS